MRPPPWPVRPATGSGRRHPISPRRSRPLRTSTSGRSARSPRLPRATRTSS